MIQRFLSENKKKHVSIYGIGVYGRRVFECLKILQITIQSFVVTKKMAEMESKIDEIPVLGLAELPLDFFVDSEIIVAVDERNHQDIRRAIEERYGVMPEEDAGNRNVVFCKKADIDKLFRETHPFDEHNFLISAEPVSRLYGNDRGTPIDRYYIENFLRKESKGFDSSGRTLEVGEDTYSRQFFPLFAHDILDYSKGMDLTKYETLPKEIYDIFICTQTFHQIFDVKSALEGSRYLLKNNGVMLATVCGNITKLAHNDEYEHYWGFTKPSIERLVKDVFGEEVYVEAYGNCMAATAFLQGISLEEVDRSLLDVRDTDYTICISIAARKIDG